MGIKHNERPPRLNKTECSEYWVYERRKGGDKLIKHFWINIEFTYQDNREWWRHFERDGYRLEVKNKSGQRRLALYEQTERGLVMTICDIGQKPSRAIRVKIDDYYTWFNQIDDSAIYSNPIRNLYATWNGAQWVVIERDMLI